MLQICLKIINFPEIFGLLQDQWALKNAEK